MTKDYGLRKFGTKAAKVLLAGTMVAAFAPGMAFAHYEYNNTTGRAIIGDAGDPLNGGVEVVEKWDGHSIRYRGYAHSDNGGHYQAYSLYTKVTVDDNGILTAVDITSGDDTFAGTWGYSQKSGRGTPVNGFLPDGVDFVANQNSDGTYTPVLSGTEKYNNETPVPTVTYISTNAEGTADSAGNGTKAVEDTGAIANGKITVPAVDGNADYYNLVRCRYMIGSEKTTFDTYFSVGAHKDDADKYIDNCIPDTTWDEVPSRDYTTNRDGWTAIMGTMVLRQLESWGVTMKDKKVSTDIDGEIGTIDTVSGATKTSVPFITAMVKARKDGYIKGVSENVQVTIDGSRAANEKSLPGLTVNNAVEGTSFQDKVSVVKGSDGLYTVAGTFKPYGGGRLSLDAVTVYDLSSVKLGTMGVMALSKELSTKDNQFQQYVLYQQIPDNKNSAGEPAFYDTDDESHIIAFGARATDESTFTITGRGTAPSYTYNIGGDGSVVECSFTKVDDATISYTIKTKDPKATHLAMTYTLGHGRITSVYDLENQSKVAGVSALLAAATADDAKTLDDARKAYNELPYDVRPYTTGISNLETEEAKWVTALINVLPTNTNKNAASAAKAAYDLLDASAKAQVDSATVKALDKAVEAAKKANTLKLASSKATVKYAKVKKKKQTVTIKAKSAKGTVTYSVKSAAAKKKVSVSKKGVVTLKKGAKKGKYVITVKAAGNSSYKAGSKTFTITVK